MLKKGTGSQCATLTNSTLLSLFSEQGARRIVAEWPDLDQEARDFTSRIQQVESLETEPPPLLGPDHIEEVLAKVEEIGRTKVDNIVPNSVDKESAAEL